MLFFIDGRAMGFIPRLRSVGQRLGGAGSAALGDGWNPKGLAHTHLSRPEPACMVVPASILVLGGDGLSQVVLRWPPATATSIANSDSSKTLRFRLLVELFTAVGDVGPALCYVLGEVSGSRWSGLDHRLRQRTLRISVARTRILG